MRRLIFFDLDGTLLGGKSSESAFLRRLLRKGYIGWRQVLATLFFMFSWGARYKHFVFIKDKAYLAGLAVDHISRIGQVLTRDELLAYLRPAVIKRLKQHQKAGDIIILLTGTFDFIARVFAEHLDIELIEATRCAERENRFLCAPPLQHPFHRDKLDIARRLCSQYNVPLQDCVAYGNSRNDILLLSHVGRPVAVHPDRKLKKTALKNHWEIIVRAAKSF